MSHKANLASSSANCKANSFPIPLPAPVTRTTCKGKIAELTELFTKASGSRMLRLEQRPSI